jgi:rhamnose utilization protein RhaD (predicted bifunctional aldolase and dehydrogenase)
MTKMTLSEFAKVKKQRDMDQAEILKYVAQYCKALEKNYRDYSIRSYNRSLDDNPEYYQARIDELMSGKTDMKFTTISGKKYYKVIHTQDDSSSVHSFVDKVTGEVYKPASWKAPAKHVRYNFLNEEQRAFLLSGLCDWAGGYLYADSGMTSLTGGNN